MSTISGQSICHEAALLPYMDSSIALGDAVVQLIQNIQRVSNWVNSTADLAARKPQSTWSE